MSHDDLVSRAVKWLENTQKCSVVLGELVTYARETPDAIGFANHRSVLVECKASRADFLSDKNKFTRKFPDKGMGEERYYMTTPKMIFPDELPESWGLLWVYPSMVKVIVKAARQQANYKDERRFLFSIVRRIKIRGCIKNMKEES